MLVEDLVKRLERENADYWDWTGSLVQSFFKSNPTKEQMLEWLKQRWWNEIKTVHWCGEILKAGGEEMGREGDFDLIQSIGKQVWDEARHYKMLGDCIINLGGSVKDFKPYPSWAKMFGTYIDTLGSGNILFGFAGSMFTGEGSAGVTAPIIIKECASKYPEVSHAYAIIDRDERFHKDNGKRGIERYATTEESQKRALEAAGFVREMQRKAWEEIYGV